MFEDDNDNLDFSDDLVLGKTEYLDDGSAVVELTSEDEDTPLLTAEAQDHDANLAQFLSDEELKTIATRLDERFAADKESTSDFYEAIEKGISRLGLTIKQLDDPFPGATPITHPLIMEAAVKTQAKIMGEVFSGKGIVDTYIQGDKTPEKLDQCVRVKNFLDYQYLFQMKEYIPETERLTFRYALTGNAFRKYYFDPISNRQSTRYITEDKFIASWDGTLISDLDFHTEILPLMDRYEVEVYVENGIFREDLDIERIFSNYNEPSQIDGEIADETKETFAIVNTSQAVIQKAQFLETHCYLKLPEPFNDGEARMLPYSVIWEENTGQIAAIRRNWKRTDALKIKRDWYVHYKLVPGLGFYAYGYIHLLQNFQFSLTLMLRSLLDAGQFANMKGGFVQKGVLRVKGNSKTAIAMGEWKEVDTGSKTIKDALLPMDYGEPSQVLERLFVALDARAQQFADSTESVIADSTNYGPVGTTIALLEASTKFMSGIQKRFYHSLTEEFQILHDFNQEILDEGTVVSYKSGTVEVGPEDFMGAVGVIPQADPNLSSSSHRIALAQTKLEAALRSPEIHNVRAAYVEFYGTIGMDQNEINQLLPPEEELTPNDPLTDLKFLAGGKAIKAFEGQDHDAHILFKQAFLADPQGGMNPDLMNLVPLVQANISEHQFLKWSASIGGVAMATGNSMGTEFDQAQAAVHAQEVNSMSQTLDMQKASDPNMMIAEATLKDADTRAKLADHKVERDIADLTLESRDQEIEIMKLQQKNGENITDQLANMSNVKTQAKASILKTLIDKALGNLATPNKDDKKLSKDE